MQLRILVLALSAALGAACAATDGRRAGLDVRPVLAVRHAAQDADSYYRLGRYYHGQSRLARAEEAYRRATELDARHVDAHNALASLYAERGELERAERAFQALSEMAPAAAHVYNNLGYIRLLLARPEEAYAALRRALALDDQLARAWGHLRRIADGHPGAGLGEALAARRADLLPGGLGVAAASPPEAAAPLPAPLPVEPLPAAPALAAESGRGDARQDFLLVSAVGDLVAGGAASDSPVDEADFSAVRLEVANGNGVARFARKFSARLRADQIPVSRITNLGHFRLAKTVIEYQPGHEAAAQALVVYLGGAVQAAAAGRPRPRSDIRIMLGRDAVAL